MEFVLNSVSCPLMPEQTLFEAAEHADMRLNSSCAQQGKCGECLIQVEAGMEWLTPRRSEESHLKAGFRLACCCRVDAPAAGRILAHTLARGGMRIEDDGHMVADADVCDAGPPVKRIGDCVYLEDRPIARSTAPLYGVALDLGTTTCVARLIDLESGALLEVESFENPQRFAGTDVMARIHYDSGHKGRLLRRAIIKQTAKVIENFPVAAENIYEVLVVGNSTMRDIFFGLDVRSIGQKPYWSLTQHELERGERQSTALVESPRRAGLPIHPEGRVLSLPLISGHVGADITADLLAINLDVEQRTVALMDIGTNTELVLKHRGRILAASCPAGPAFEGGSIQHGMPALAGAIEGVVLDDSGQPMLRIIGEAPPLGICGSGLIEALSELLRLELIDSSGRFTNGADRFMLDAERDVFLHEADINELAQAKGANVAGLSILLDRMGIDIEEIDLFYLAGGFGRHIDLESARRIGLIPNLPDQKIMKIGNAAITGASIALRSGPKRRQAEALVKSIEHVSLETHERFFDYFVAGCQFFPMDADLLEKLG